MSVQLHKKAQKNLERPCEILRIVHDAIVDLFILFVDCSLPLGGQELFPLCWVPTCLVHSRHIFQI